MNGYKLNINGKEIKVKLLDKNENSMRFKVSGQVYEVMIENADDFPGQNQTNHDAETHLRTDNLTSISENAKSVLAPMPGLIVNIPVKEKQNIKTNSLLLTMEAMKMENNILAPFDCKIKKIHVKKGEEVSNQQILISFE